MDGINFIIVAGGVCFFFALLGMIDKYTQWRQNRKANTEALKEQLGKSRFLD